MREEETMKKEKVRAASLWRYGGKYRDFARRCGFVICKRCARYAEISRCI